MVEAVLEHAKTIEAFPEWIVKLRPTKELIDFPQDSQKPVFAYHVREGESIELENAWQLTVLEIDSLQHHTVVQLKPICLRTINLLGYAPLEFDGNIVSFGERARLKVDKLKPDVGKVKFILAMSRQIIEQRLSQNPSKQVDE